MAARIPVSWIFLIAVLALFAFFGYHIVQAYSGDSSKHISTFAPQDAPTARYSADPVEAGSAHPTAHDTQVNAPAIHTPHPIPHSMPHVVGQTEQDLREPEPLQASPPSMQYDVPEAMDPLNNIVHMSSEFGSNLRHPEQMIESRPPPSMDSALAAGLASEHNNPGGNRASEYTPEMAQNGGEFMSGIMGFDGSSAGTGYSML